MSEQTKSKGSSEELTKEQLEGVSGGSFDIIAGVAQPIKPPADPLGETLTLN